MATQPLFEDNLDPTKIVGIDITSIEAGTTRTIVMPDTDCTLFDSADLGTFTGNTISDNTDIITALQELESAVESRVDPDATRTYSKAAKTAYKTLTDTGEGTTITLDLDDSNTFSLSLTSGGNVGRSLDLVNATVGQRFMLIIKQPATGDGVVNWWAGVRWPFGQTPFLSSGSGAQSDIFEFICTGPNEYESAMIGTGNI